MARRRTEEQEVIEFLLEQGFKPVPEEEKEKDWYKKAKESIDCFEGARSPQGLRVYKMPRARHRGARRYRLFSRRTRSSRRVLGW